MMAMMTLAHRCSGCANAYGAEHLTKWSAARAHFLN